MRIGVALVAVAGLGLAAFLLVMARPVGESAAPPPAAMRGAESDATMASKAAGPAGERQAARPPAGPALTRPSVRAVSPDVVAPPPVDPGAVERIEPRAPLGEMGLARSKADGPPQETILYRPVAESAGAFSAQGYDIALAGLVPTPADMVCGERADAWPCGIHARTAFRNYLRGRALACIVPPVPPGEILVVSCSLAGEDPAAWLVEQGWARAAPDGDYSEAGERARVAGRGLFGAGASG